MNTFSPALFEFVQTLEGFHVDLYKTSDNYTAIGFGHYVHDGAPNGTEPWEFQRGMVYNDAIDLLREDLTTAAAWVNQYVTVTLRPHQFDALVSFAYSVGEERFHQSQLVIRLNRGNWQAGAYEMGARVYVGGVPIKVLVHRRTCEGNLYDYGHYDVPPLLSKVSMPRITPVWDPIREYEFLRDIPELIQMPLAVSPAEQLDSPKGGDYVTTSVVKVWKRLGGLLRGIATFLDIPLSSAVAWVAESSGQGYAANGLLWLHFDFPQFEQRWGQYHPTEWRTYFQALPFQEWHVEKWRDTPNGEWRRIYPNPRMGWDIFDFARTLDEEAALASAQIGMGYFLGAIHASVGYGSAGEMLDAFVASEHAQVLALFDLIAGPYQTSHGIEALRRKDYATFAALNIYFGRRGPSEQAYRFRRAAGWFEALAL